MLSDIIFSQFSVLFYRELNTPYLLCCTFVNHAFGLFADDEDFLATKDIEWCKRCFGVFHYWKNFKTCLSFGFTFLIRIAFISQ